MNKPVTGCYIDNETYQSVFFDTFKNAIVEAWDILKTPSSKRPFREVPEEILKRQNIAGDHGGLVLGSLLNTFGKEQAIHLLLGIKHTDENTSSDDNTPNKKNHQEKDFWIEFQRAINNNEQWPGFAGFNFQTELGFDVAKRILDSGEILDFVGQSYVWHQSETGLIEEEIERNAFFYFPAKQQIPFMKNIMPVLNKIETELFGNEPHLPQLLSDWRTTLDALRQQSNDSLEELYLSEQMQTHFKIIKSRYEIIRQHITPNTPHKEDVKKFIEMALLTLKNLEPVQTADEEQLRCVSLTNNWRSKHAETTPSQKDVEDVFNAFDDKNIGVFTADSLQQHYKVFVHGIEDTHPPIPLIHRDDNRVALLPPNRTVLFDNELSHAPVPDTFKGKDGYDNIGRGGVSALIPKMAGLFALTRSIDSDIHQKEFLELILLSGDIVHVDIQGKKSGRTIMQYGGVLPNRIALLSIVEQWKNLRGNEIPYAKATIEQRKNRQLLFTNFLKKMKSREFQLTSYQAEQTDGKSLKINNLSQAHVTRITYQAYYNRFNQVATSSFSYHGRS